MISLYIGSSEVNFLIANKNSVAYKKLWQRFTSDERPYYNSYNSPIDALRTGKILEERYLNILPDDYYEQCKTTCKELNVLTSTIDFGKLDSGQLIDFDELKTCNFNDFLKIQEAKENDDFDYVKKTYRSNYNQMQFQLLCSGLKEANLVFIVVYTYDDDINYERNIKENEVVKFRVKRDEKVISLIKNRAGIFQYVKDHFITL